MTINESIDTQAEIDRLRLLVEELERTGNDPLKLRHIWAELRYYEELEMGDQKRCVRNSRLAEIARLNIDRETWLISSMSSCKRERELAHIRLDSIDSTIKLIQSYIYG